MAVFDREAQSYDRWYETRLGKFADEVEEECAFRLFKVKEGMRVLDIGCGTGNYSIKLAEKGCKVIGIDVSNEMLKIAREKAENKGLDIEFYNMSVYELKFDNGYFDGVFSMAAFEFIKEPDKAMEEIFRVVKKEGQILIGTINRDSPWGQLYLSKGFQENSVFKYADFKTIEAIKALKKENLVKISECLFIPPNINEDEINMEKEEELSTIQRGGFICALWKK